MSSVRVEVEVAGRLYRVEREVDDVITGAVSARERAVVELDEAVADLKAALRIPPAPHPAL